MSKRLNLAPLNSPKEIPLEDLIFVTGGLFPVRVGWKMLTHPTRVGDSSADAWYAGYAAQEAAKAAAQAREAQQARALAWKSAHPDFFRTPTIQESINQRWEGLGHHLARASRPYHPQLHQGHH